MRNDNLSAPARPLARLTVAAIVSGALACGDPDRPTAPTRPSAPPVAASASGTYNNFYNVQVQPEGFAINVYFQYIGKGSPILSLGKTSDVFNSLVTWVPAKNMNNGYWLARIANLTPGTQYYYRLDDLQSTWSGSVKTYRRRLIVDLNRIHITSDGDDLGCGEMISRMRVGEVPSPSNYGSLYYTGWHCVNSGQNLDLSDAEGRRTYDDWTAKKVSLLPKAFEEDSCGYWDYVCGAIASAPYFLYFDTQGGAKSYTFKTTSVSVSDLKVVWEGTVKTTFVP